MQKTVGGSAVVGVNGRSGRTVACVDVRPATDDPSTVQADIHGLALQQIGRAVRADDRICPLSTSRFAVEFGDVASGPSPRILGDRLARAVGETIVLNAPGAPLTVSVGVAEPEPHQATSAVTRRALSAATAGSAQLGRRLPGGARPGHSAVTVDSLVAGRSIGADPALCFQSIHRRTVHRFDHRRDRPSGPGGTADDRGAWSGNTGTGTGAPLDLMVLVVDPMGHPADGPGFAAMTAAAMVAELGCCAHAVTAGPDEPLTTTMGGIPVDLVVLVMDGGRPGQSTTWSSGSWSSAGRLTAAYRKAGMVVLAVSAGAGAGALASCVNKGALALFNVELLPTALRSLTRCSNDELRNLAELHFPPRFTALVGLTPSERRVLFYLTEGWPAQEIADQLVVSMTTVRSHIRSVLRKLGVRSQLAAVALANSRDLAAAQLVGAG